MKKSANWWLALPKNKPRKLFWVMKLPFLMCVFFATSVSAEVWSQQRLTMRLGETGLKEVFKEIQRQTNKAVVYNDDQLTLSKKVKANFTDAVMLHGKYIIGHNKMEETFFVLFAVFLC